LHLNVTKLYPLSRLVIYGWWWWWKTGGGEVEGVPVTSPSLATPHAHRILKTSFLMSSRTAIL